MIISQSPTKVKACVDAAHKLLAANNTVTNLEIKTELINASETKEYYWDQDIVHHIMDNAYKNGEFKIAQDNGTYRTYSAVKATKAPKAPKAAAPSKPMKASKLPVKWISRKQALELIQNTKGHFFTATFTKKDQSDRTINCQYLKDQADSTLGYVKVKEASALKKGDNAVRNLNLQTLLELKTGGTCYKIRSNR